LLKKAMDLEGLMMHVDTTVDAARLEARATQAR
jgi:hypothetical protein